MAQKTQVINYDFRGGLNTDSPSELLAKNELQKANNVMYGKRGEVKRRWGTVKVNSASYNATIEQLIKFPRKDGTIDKLAVFNEAGTYTLKKFADDGTTTSVQVVQRANLAYFNFEDELYFIDGTNYYRYDGNSINTVNTARRYLYGSIVEGEPIIGEVLTCQRLVPTTTNGVFNRTGTFGLREKVRGETSGATAIVYGDDGTLVYVYDINGTFLEGETISSLYDSNNKLTFNFLQVYDCELRNLLYENANTIFGVNLLSGILTYFYKSDNYLFGKQSRTIINFQTAEGDRPNNLETIKKCKYAVKHTNSFRFFYAGNPDDQSALYYSEYNQPDFIKKTSVIYPSEAEGPITGLKEMMGHLVVSFKNADYVYTGNDPATNAEWKKIPSIHGTYSCNSTVLTSNSLVTYADNGIYVKFPSLLGLDDNMVPGEQFIKNIAKDKVESILSTITDDEKVTSCYDPYNDILLMAFCDDGTGRNNKILMYDWKLGAFSLWIGINAYDFMIMPEGDIYIATDNYILKFDENTYTDIDTTTGENKQITFEVATSMHHGEPFLLKEYNKFYLTYKNTKILIDEVAATYEPITLKCHLIFDKNHYTVSPLSDWDIFFEAKEDTTNDKLTIIRKPIHKTGSRVYLVILNSEDCPLEIYGYGYEFKYVNTIGNS